jgi:hypothetical protein
LLEAEGEMTFIRMNLKSPSTRSPTSSSSSRWISSWFRRVAWPYCDWEAARSGQNRDFSILHEYCYRRVGRYSRPRPPKRHRLRRRTGR